MAKLVSNLMRAQIALLNPLLRRMDVKSARYLQDGLGALGAHILTDSVVCRPQPFAQFEASWAETASPVPNRAILYLHGGSYTAGSLVYAQLFGGVLAETTGWPVLCVGYRLAPEHPYPAALNDALIAYRYLLATHAPQEIVFVGESAGGGLCACLCLRLKELGLPQPARVVALSPWTNLAMDGDYSEQESRDPVLSKDNLRYSAQLYAGEQIRLPTVSPVYGDLSGLPPFLLFAGTDEILLQDSQRLAEKLRACGGSCELHVAKDMWHVYVIYGVPEAKEALERIAGFVREE